MVGRGRAGSHLSSTSHTQPKGDPHTLPTYRGNRYPPLIRLAGLDPVPTVGTGTGAALPPTPFSLPNTRHLLPPCRGGSETRPRSPTNHTQPKGDPPSLPTYRGHPVPTTTLSSRAKPRDLKRPSYNHAQPKGDQHLFVLPDPDPVPMVGTGAALPPTPFSLPNTRHLLAPCRGGSQTRPRSPTNHTQPKGDPLLSSTYRGHPVPTGHGRGAAPPQTPVAPPFDSPRTSVLLSILSRAT